VRLGTAPAGAQTLTSNGKLLLVGTGAEGHLLSSPAVPMNWKQIGVTGSNPIYPG
jgi:hypothetical protein